MDDTPTKQGKYLPGMKTPIYIPEVLKLSKPKFLVVLSWNNANEIIEKTQYIKEWGGKHVVKDRVLGYA